MPRRCIFSAVRRSLYSLWKQNLSSSRAVWCPRWARASSPPASANCCRRAATRSPSKSSTPTSTSTPARSTPTSTASVMSRKTAWRPTSTWGTTSASRASAPRATTPSRRAASTRPSSTASVTATIWGRPSRWCRTSLTRSSAGCCVRTSRAKRWILSLPKWGALSATSRVPPSWRPSVSCAGSWGATPSACI